MKNNGLCWKETAFPLCMPRTVAACVLVSTFFDEFNRLMMRNAGCFDGNRK